MFQMPGQPAFPAQPAFAPTLGHAAYFPGFPPQPGFPTQPGFPPAMPVSIRIYRQLQNCSRLLVEPKSLSRCQSRLVM